MIVVLCPRCDKEYRLADSLRGQVLTCPDCGASIRVEPPEDDDEPILLESVPDEELRADEEHITGEEPAPPPLSVAPKKLRTERIRKKKKKRPPNAGNVALDLFYYVFGAVGVFGFVLAGMFACWLLMLPLTLLAPRLALAQVALGGVLQLVGWWWIVFVAFRDDALYGSLCVFTFLFAYVYVYMNLEGTWRPAGLMILGLLMTISGNVLGIYLGVIKF
jgi:hypothetical protein